VPLIASDHREGPDRHQRTRREGAVQGIAAVDLTCALKVLGVEGVSAGELLARACSLDPHARSFLPGACTRTHLAQATLVVDCADPTPGFDLYVGRSFLAYLRSWLLR
jgi:sarcosine oxidase, subunit gamma